MNFYSLIPVAIICRIRALPFQLKLQTTDRMFLIIFEQQKNPIILHVDIVDKIVEVVVIRK